MKLRIAYIIPSFPTISETFIVNQLTDMIDRGHEVYIYSFEENKETKVHQKIKDYNLLNLVEYFEVENFGLWGNYKLFFKYLLKNKGSFRELLFHFRFDNLKNALTLKFYHKYYWLLKTKKDPDIIHVHFADRAKIITDMKNEGFYSKSSMVVSFHGYDLEPNKLDFLKKIYDPVFKTADLLTYNSAYSLSLLNEINPKCKKEFLPVGLDTAKFSNDRMLSRDEFTIIFVGRLVKFKGPDVAIDIFETLIHKGFNFKMVIVGDGPMKIELTKLIAQKGLSKVVTIKGALSQEQVIEEYKRSDLLLLPGVHDGNGRAENQGLVIQEAQAMEIPVVVSDAGGMKYGLIKNKTGYVVKEGDISSYVEKIEYLYKNKKKRISMGKAGREYVKENFESGILGERLELLYHEILKSRS